MGTMESIQNDQNPLSFLQISDVENFNETTLLGEMEKIKRIVDYNRPPGSKPNKIQSNQDNIFALLDKDVFDIEDCELLRNLSKSEFVGFQVAYYKKAKQKNETKIVTLDSFGKIN